MNRYTRPLIYFVEDNDPELNLSAVILARLSNNNAVIIWKNQGAFKLITSARIHNHWMAVQTIARQKKFNPRNTPPKFPFFWSSGIQISPQVVKVLRADAFTDHVLNSLKEHSPPQ